MEWLIFNSMIISTDYLRNIGICFDVNRVIMLAFFMAVE